MHGHDHHLARPERVRTWRRWRALVPVVALLGTGVVLTTGLPAAAVAAFPSSNPTRLYMAPAGVSIPNGVAQLVGVDVGTLVFDGDPDPISQDVRTITVDTVNGPLGCNPIDKSDGSKDYDIDDCSRLYLDVAHGRLRAGDVTTVFRDDPQGNDNPADPVHRYASGAILDAFGNGVNNTTDPNSPTGFRHLEIVGTETAINDTLKALVYVPDSGYHYAGAFNAEELDLQLVSGDPNDATPIANHTTEIRVLGVNGFPDLTGPAGDKQAQPMIELLMPAGNVPASLPYTGAEWTVTDPDNDEIVDGDQANPPVQEEDIIDGEGTKMLLLGFLDCGQPVAPNTGFHFRGGTFVANQNDIESLLVDAGLPADAVTAALTAMEAIKPGITTIPLATSDPFTYTEAFAGIGEMDDVLYALSQITFLHNSPSDSCDLWTIVSDLGNNGLPLQYIGDPPTGVEVPMLGFDWHKQTIATGALQQIDVSFVQSQIAIVEPAIGTPARAQIKVTPATHPPFSIQWDAVDGPVVGGATAGSDYAGTSNNTLFIDENVEFIPIDVLNPLPAENPIETNVFPDTADEGPETFTYEIDNAAIAPPAGYVITSTVPTATVTIVDDDDAPNTVALQDGSVVEGDTPGTSILNIPVVLSGPADGTEVVTVETQPIGGGATAGVDFTSASAVIGFDVGQTGRVLQVTIIGDDAPENDEQFAVTITDSNVTPTDNAAVGTIIDDDGPEPEVTINDVSANEGNAGTTNFSFTISLNVPAAGGETIEWNTSDGAATEANNDYEGVNPPQQLLFATGEQQKTVTVVVNGDTTVEPGEAFFVNLGNAVGLVPVDAQGQGTIQNDDSNPNVSIGDVTQVEGNAGTTSMTFTLSLDKAALGGESVEVDDASSSAGEPGDYTFTGPQTVSFSPGDLSKTVTVTINGDTAPEADESFTLNLSNAAGGLIIADGQATGTITNDDAGTSVISIADATSTEGGALEDAIISMTNFAGRNCFVEVTSADGTAIGGGVGDYGPYTAVIVPVLGVGQQPFALSVLDDPEVEPDETFTLTIALGQGSDQACVLGDSSAVITIVSDDVASVVSIADTSIAEPSLTGPISVTMTNDANRTCVVDVTSSDGSALAPADYAAIPANTSLSLQNAPVGNLQLSVENDSTPEGPETFTVTITLDAQSDPQCVLGDATATVTITDDDVVDNTPPTVTVEQAVGQADPTSASPILFTATFSEPVTGFQTGDVTVSGTALPTAAVVTPVSATVYTLEVSGMSLSGTVLATLAAGVAQDGASNPSQASSSVDNQVQFDLPAGDVTPPTVTVEQAVGQADPTSASPILFTATFSEPVTGFQTGDVTVSGTAGANGAAVTPVSTTVFQIEVTGMTQSGTVIASLAAGVAIDAANNPNQASTSVDNTVQLEIADTGLTLNLPPNQTADNDPGQAGAIVNYPTVTASGGVPPVVVDCAPISGSFFPLGTTTVTCTATDAEEFFQGEAIVSGSFTVTVVDVEPPVIADNPDLTRSTVGNAPVTVTFALPAASDNSGVPPTVVCAPVSGTSFGVGVTTVTCTATDGAGNTASSSFTVTVTSTGSGVPAPTTPTTTPPTTNPIGALPATGSDPLILVLMGIVLLSGGAVLIAGARRRSA